MIPQEENNLLTQIGRGTPCGDLMRCYWQVVALTEELAAGGAPLEVKLLGEELVLFRDDQGRPGLLGLHCSHRGADLSYGRVEDGGLRYRDASSGHRQIGFRCAARVGNPA